MVIQDIEAEPLFLNRTQARKKLESRKFAFLCVPIKVSNKIIGALSVDHLFKGDISYEEDINLLMIIAAMVGQTVRVRELAEKDKELVVAENFKLRQQLKGKYKFGNIVYTSALMEQTLEAAMQVAAGVGVASRAVSAAWQEARLSSWLLAINSCSAPQNTPGWVSVTASS